MCLLIVFVFGIVFACRIPGLRKMPPPANVDVGLFEQWRVLELRSIYMFLAATWGLTALLTARSRLAPG
ncbi:MAG TPA: hypothetical protein VHE55_17190 [Fimbriimonadaceae bacterium]|nr:hypothetical protein [Fimbriimonadaceae bacterium]